MENLFSQLKNIYGSHWIVAEKLGYTDRQYRNIRKKVALGGELPARIESLLHLKLQAAQDKSSHIGSGGMVPR